jgi:predicted ABC-class ATPase
VGLLESFRDRVVQRSQVGKRRLDATFARRELDRKLQELGGRFLELARQGGAVVPQELAALVEEVRGLEDRLRGLLADIAALEGEG